MAGMSIIGFIKTFADALHTTPHQDLLINGARAPTRCCQPQR